MVPRHDILTRILAAVMLALLIGAPVHAVRTQRYIHRVIVTPVDAPVPEVGAEWRQVARRDDLSDVLGMYTPSWRNFWFPVRFRAGDLAADTAAVAHYYRTLGYLDARVVSSTTEPVRVEDDIEEVDVIIVLDGIRETERYELVATYFDGVEALDALRLSRAFKRRHPERGTYFSPARALKNLYDVGRRYANAGYLDTSAVQIVQAPLINPERRTVAEYYVVNEKQPFSVGGMALRSETAIHVDSSVFVNAFHDAGLLPGARLSRERILDAERFLLDLNVIRLARITLEDIGSERAVGASGGDVPRTAVVSVAEHEPGDIRGTVGYSSVSGWRAEGGVYYHNFLRRARTLGQEADVRIEQGRLELERLRLSALYAQPRVAFPGWTPVVGGRAYRIRMDQRVSALWEVADLTTGGASSGDSLDAATPFRRLSWSVGFGRRFSGTTRLSISYEIARTDSARSIIDRGSDPSWDRTVTVSGTYDTREDFLKPSDAVVASGQISFADVSLTNTTFRSEGLLQYYRRLDPLVVAAVSFGGGLYHPATTETYDISGLFWRSAQTPIVRGLERDDLTTVTAAPATDTTSGTLTSGLPAMAYMLARAEIRVDPWETVGFAAYVDAAQAWTPDLVLSDETGLLDVGNIANGGFSAIRPAGFGISAGFGGRWYTVLPVRIDFAFPIVSGTGWKLEFGVGQAF